MNKTLLIGRLTKEPEVRYTPSQKVATSFTLAVNRDYKNADGTRDADFIPIIAWGKIAEMCGNNLTKGTRILVEGRIQVRSYDDKDGSRRWMTEVIAENIRFLDPPKQSDQKAE
ncbi:MAG: single-stranded DNA-binding protein [Treponema sp.]|nr:single-stranded DNA-binding protein [Treponema sp.]